MDLINIQVTEQDRINTLININKSFSIYQFTADDEFSPNFIRIFIRRLQ